MQAITFEAFGDAGVLRLSEVADPELRPADLLVRVGAAGVNRADLSQRRGAYGRPDFGDSSLMGLEIAGEVVSVGDEVSDFAPGDRVMGIVGGGAYATLARIDHRMAMHVPRSLSIVEAGAIMETFVTAHEALLHLAATQPGETVLIHAAGSGVGTAALQLAGALPATVIVTASAGKHARLRNLGAAHCIDYKAVHFDEAVAEITGGRGVDAIIDLVGVPNLARNIMSLAEGGRLVQVGLMGGGGAASLPLDRVLFRHLRIFGTVMKSRSPAEKHAVLARFRDRWAGHLADGRLRPVIDSTFPLARAADAHRHMESDAAFGKIVLTVD